MTTTSDSENIRIPSFDRPERDALHVALYDRQRVVTFTVWHDDVPSTVRIGNDEARKLIARLWAELQ